MIQVVQRLATKAAQWFRSLMPAGALVPVQVAASPPLPDPEPIPPPVEPHVGRGAEP